MLLIMLEGKIWVIVYWFNMLGIFIFGNGFIIDGFEFYEVCMVILVLVIGVCVFLGIS